MPHENGGRERRERRLLDEFLAEKYPNFPRWVGSGARVGELPGTEQDKFFKVIRQFPDAIVFTGTEVLLIEAKLFNETSGIGQLLSYREAFPKTPEFQIWKGMPLRLLLVTSRNIADVRRVAESVKIEYVFFKPSWVDGYYLELLEKHGKSV